MALTGDMGKLPFWAYPAAIVLVFALYEVVVMFLEALGVLPTGTKAPGW
jgi:hypothetical protein